MHKTFQPKWITSASNYIQLAAVFGCKSGLTHLQPISQSRSSQPAEPETLKWSYYLSMQSQFLFLKCLRSMPSQVESNFFLCCCDADGSGHPSQSRKICEIGFNWKAVMVHEPNGLPFLALKQRKSYSTTQQVSGVQLQLHCFLIECPTFCLSRGKINQVYNKNAEDQSKHCFE